MRRSTVTFTDFVQRHRSQLERLALEGKADPKLSDNAMALLMMAEGVSIKEVARQLGGSQNGVMAVRRRFMLLGMPSLHGRGVHPPLCFAHLASKRRSRRGEPAFYR
jgi:DNA-binding CsgD family transcriptional regulator